MNPGMMEKRLGLTLFSIFGILILLILKLSSLKFCSKLDLSKINIVNLFYKIRNGRKYLELLGKGAQDDNYFEIIEQSKEILKDNDWWVG